MCMTWAPKNQVLACKAALTKPIQSKSEVDSEKMNARHAARSVPIDVTKSGDVSTSDLSGSFGDNGESVADVWYSKPFWWQPARITGVAQLHCTFTILVFKWFGFID